MSELILVGAIAGAFGVRGEVKLKSFTETPADIFTYGPLLSKDGKAVLTMTSKRKIKDGFAVTSAEVKDRDTAEGLKSTKLYVPRSMLPKLAEDEFYHSDLLEMTVTDLSGADMGTIRAVHDFGAGDMLEIHKTPGRKGSWYLPFTREAVPHVDIAAGVVTIDPPLEDDSEDAPKS